MAIYDPNDDSYIDEPEDFAHLLPDGDDDEFDEALAAADEEEDCSSDMFPNDEDGSELEDYLTQDFDD